MKDMFSDHFVLKYMPRYRNKILGENVIIKTLLTWGFNLLTAESLMSLLRAVCAQENECRRTWVLVLAAHQQIDKLFTGECVFFFFFCGFFFFLRVAFFFFFLAKTQSKAFFQSCSCRVYSPSLYGWIATLKWRQRVRTLTARNSVRNECIIHPRADARECHELKRIGAKSRAVSLPWVRMLR